MAQTPPPIIFRGRTFHTRRTPDAQRDEMNAALDVLMAAYIDGVPTPLEERGASLRVLCSAILAPGDYAALSDLGRLADDTVVDEFMREALPAILRAAAVHEDDQPAG